MKPLLVSILCLASTYTFAQRLPPDGSAQVRITEENRTIRFEVLPVHAVPAAVPDKWYYWYGSNRIQTTQGGFSGKLLNGAYSAFYLNKNLMEQGSFKNGLKNGIWKDWKENGKISRLMTWKEGVASGKFILYSDSGTVSRTGNYHNGLMNGPVQTYRGKDTVITTRYRDGVLQQDRKPFLKRIVPFRKKKPGA